MRWTVPAGLLALLAVPLTVAVVRLAQGVGGALAVHVASVTLYCGIGAFQFLPALRRRAWHRRAGRLLLPAGLAAAVSGLWLAVEAGHDVLMAVRLCFGGAMLASLVLGLAAILRRDVRGHRAWMMRAFAIGAGAGTQAFVQAPWVMLVGQPAGAAKAFLLSVGWLINLAVAEWLVQTRF
ncbi:MAG: DUF2306 domain-containing protein, partial [Nonomuraea sp.]|nr:DUF2306 domain-containing protein [Nonomuraea sp.]